MKKIAAACLFSVLSALATRADIIYFKDGLKTVCQDKAWEENGQVKCEYGGWTITYKKSDVLRILSTTPPTQTDPPTSPPPVQTKIKPAQSGSPKQIQSPSAGIAFYDPRRPLVYWTDENTKHKSYKAAIQALADQYDRPADWIQTHMGDTNDLSEIHRNLAKSNLDQAQTPTKRPEKIKPKLEFYNPRRPSPYWTDVSSKHKGYHEAIQALAQKYDRPAEWIKQYMGQTNDLAQIHQNLQVQKNTETTE